jgi:DNA-binding response OmpR family regulator
MMASNTLENRETDGSLRPIQTQPARRILVVDDEPLIRRLNTEVLTEAGYQVDTAGDGEAAWDALQFNTYDLLITDNEMPGVTGIDLLKLLRAARRTMPTIMATATLPYEEFQKHLWLQPVITLAKPYYIWELLKAVRIVLHAALIVGESITESPGRPCPHLPGSFRKDAWAGKSR